MLRPATRIAPLAALLLLLPACASKEDRVRNGLLELGLSPRAATCLAPPLARDLSADELRAIGGLARMKDQDVRAMSIDEILKRLRGLDNGHILAVASRAALGCALSF